VVIAFLPSSIAAASAAVGVAMGHAGAAPVDNLSVRVERPAGIAVFDRPRGRRLGLITMRTEWGSRRVMPVIASDGSWLRVLADVPGRRSGWIRASAADLSFRGRRWSIVAHRSRGTVTVLDRGRAVRTIAAAFGRSDSPTPRGRFAVTDRLSGGAFHGAYGCCILALSGHQSHLPRGWSGGDRLAIHATNRSVPSPSAGCIVATDADLRRLMRRAPLGTPVTIRP
jgi:lipoprotein-anchoring transpeptidase ErfK/SrfK